MPKTKASRIHVTQHVWSGHRAGRSYIVPYADNIKNECRATAEEGLRRWKGGSETGVKDHAVMVPGQVTKGEKSGVSYKRAVKAKHSD